MKRLNEGIVGLLQSLISRARKERARQHARSLLRARPDQFIHHSLVETEAVTGRLAAAKASKSGPI